MLEHGGDATVGHVAVGGKVERAVGAVDRGRDVRRGQRRLLLPPPPQVQDRLSLGKAQTAVVRTENPSSWRPNLGSAHKLIT